MKTEAIKLDPANVDLARIPEAAKLIDAGALVAFPTETVYGIACRARSESLAKLGRVKSRQWHGLPAREDTAKPVLSECGMGFQPMNTRPGWPCHGMAVPQKPFTLHIAQPSCVDKYVPTIKLNAQKLIRNAWPGPVTIVFELDEADMDKQRKALDRDVLESLYRNDSIGVRCPDHAVATALLAQTHVPVVAPSANVTGEPPAIDGEQVLRQFSGQIEMLLDAGPSKYGLSSTVVKMGKKGLEILRPGVCSREYLRSISRTTFLFVCTGNTCRSPMAEGICRKYLAEKLQCNVDDLAGIGYRVESAGVMGSAGFPASASAVTACAAMGVDLRAHKNKGLSKELIKESDLIYVMEPFHREQVAAVAPEAANRCLLLDEEGGIPDPIGQSQEVYDSCAGQIERAVKKRIGELAI